jgi:L-cysteine:1D-myo-inositol 2-amino-2-deoxy-alpha-D-glucopyranoside ligase
MSMRYLGSRLDIHCGGEDLIFPHHTCEIAQSENYSGEEPFVRYWFHVAMVRLDGEKMSKSLGNMLFVRDLLTDYSADAIRIFLLSHHYRREWAADNYHEELRDAEAMMGRWRQTLGLPPTENEAVNLNQYRAEFEAAMNDDFNTPQAIRVLDQMAHELDEAARRGQDIQAGQTLLRELGDVLGLVLDQPQQQ